MSRIDRHRAVNAVAADEIRAGLHALAIEAMSADTSLVDALAEWYGYCQWQEWDADALLRETCAEFERKHLGVAA